MWYARLKYLYAVISAVLVLCCGVASRLARADMQDAGPLVFIVELVMKAPCSKPSTKGNSPQACMAECVAVCHAMHADVSAALS